MADPVPNGKAFDVLQIMMSEPSREFYGLELVHVSKGRLQRTSIYMILTRMVAFGFLAGRLETNEEQEEQGIRGPKRRLYKITDYGKEMYKARLAANKHVLRGMPMKPTGAMS